MVYSSTFSAPGFFPVEHNHMFKCAFITKSDVYSYGQISQLKRHNDSDEVFVLLQGRATLLDCEDPQQNYTLTELGPNMCYNVKQGTWHYLAVSDDAVVFVAESGSMRPELTETASVTNIFIEAVK